MTGKIYPVKTRGVDYLGYEIFNCERSPQFSYLGICVDFSWRDVFKEQNVLWLWNGHLLSPHLGCHLGLVQDMFFKQMLFDGEKVISSLLNAKWVVNWFQSCLKRKSLCFVPFRELAARCKRSSHCLTYAVHWEDTRRWSCQMVFWSSKWFEFLTFHHVLFLLLFFLFFFSPLEKKSRNKKLCPSLGWPYHPKRNKLRFFFIKTDWWILSLLVAFCRKFLLFCDIGRWCFISWTNSFVWWALDFRSWNSVFVVVLMIFQ